MKKNKIITAIILIIIIGVFCWFNIFFPVKVSKKNNEIFIFEDSYDDNEEYNYEDYNELLSEYKNGDVSNYMKLVRLNGKLPSKNAKDYRHISLSLKMTNRGIFKITDPEGYFLGDDPDSRILYSDTADEVIHYVQGLKKEKDVPVIRFEMYVGDMSDQEIIDYIKTKELNIVYKNKLMGIKNIKIALKDLDIKVAD